MSPPWSRFARTKEAHPGYAGPGIDRLVLQISLDVGNTRKLHGGLFIAVVEPMIFREPSCQLVAEHVPADRIAVDQDKRQAPLPDVLDREGAVRCSDNILHSTLISQPSVFEPCLLCLALKSCLDLATVCAAAATTEAASKG